MVSSDDVPEEFLITWNPSANNSSTSNGTGSATNRRQSESIKLCTACDSCSQARVRCGGGSTCQRCSNNNLQCHYSSSRRSGRLKATQVSRREGPSNRQTPRSPVNYQTVPLGAQSFLDRGNDDLIQAIQPAKEIDFGAFPTPEGEDSFPFDETNDIDTFLTSFTSSQAGSFVADKFHHGHSDLNGFRAFPSTSSPTSSASHLPSLGLEGDLQSPAGISPSLRSSSSKNSSWNKSSPAKDALGGLSPGAGCGCLEARLSSIANLCNPQNGLAGSGLDAVLRVTQQTSEHISKHLACVQCTKDPTSFIFTAIIFQRLVKLFCDVAKNGAFYLASLRLGIGVFELSEEDDARHKKMLIMSTANKINAILVELEDVTRDYQQMQILEHNLGETTTESGRSNLKWVTATIRNLQSQVKTIVGIVGAHDWGTHRAA